MKRVPVTDLKNRLSEYLRLVKRGETIEIVERSVPIARIEALPPDAARGDERFEALVRAGVVRQPPERLDPRTLAKNLLPCPSDAVRTVIEERGER
jgi:antitoxin (DNA-binding transcriptional repressor) of toxin-antitoxin stability system